MSDGVLEWIGGRLGGIVLCDAGEPEDEDDEEGEWEEEDDEGEGKEAEESGFEEDDEGDLDEEGECGNLKVEEEEKDKRLEDEDIVAKTLLTSSKWRWLAWGSDSWLIKNLLSQEWAQPNLLQGHLIMDKGHSFSTCKERWERGNTGHCSCPLGQDIGNPSHSL